MTTQERTSARVARIAAKILAHKAERGSNMMLLPMRQTQIGLSWRDLKALAASALTQAPTKPTKAARGQKRPGTSSATTKTKRPRAGSVGAVRGRKKAKRTKPKGRN